MAYILAAFRVGAAQGPFEGIWLYSKGVEIGTLKLELAYNTWVRDCPKADFTEKDGGFIMPDQIVDGDLHIQRITNNASGTFQSRNGSVIIDQKIDDHSNVRILAAIDVRIGQKIDQHSQAEIIAGGSVFIGQKIDQHSVGIITAQNGNVDIGQKIDQHSWARIRVPNGTLTIGEAVDQHSHLHYEASSASIPRVDSNSTSDSDMNVGWDPSESGPGS